MFLNLICNSYRMHGNWRNRSHLGYTRKFFHRVLQGAPPRGRQLCFTFQVLQTLCSKRQKHPFLPKELQPRRGHPVKHLLILGELICDAPHLAEESKPSPAQKVKKGFPGESPGAKGELIGRKAEKEGPLLFLGQWGKQTPKPEKTSLGLLFHHFVLNLAKSALNPKNFRHMTVQGRIVAQMPPHCAKRPSKTLSIVEAKCRLIPQQPFTAAQQHQEVVIFCFVADRQVCKCLDFLQDAMVVAVNLRVSLHRCNLMIWLQHFLSTTQSHTRRIFPLSEEVVWGRSG